MLPNNLLNHWDCIAELLINNVTPVVGASSGAFASVTGLFKNKEKMEKKRERRERYFMEGLGIGSKELDELYEFVMKCAFAEQTKGANDEARLCLKSVEGECGWGPTEDYPVLVGNLKRVWEERVKGGAAKLQVKIVFAEDDVMIGVKGAEYFENCWTESKCGAGIMVSVDQTMKTNHDSVVEPGRKSLRTLFEKVKKGES